MLKLVANGRRDADASNSAQCPNKNTSAQISSGSVLVTSAFSASHATLDPDRACNAAQDGTLWLSKAAIRPTQMMKAGDTFLCVRCVTFISRVMSTIANE